MGTISVVYDTNVLVSGIGFGGKPWECLLLSFVGDLEMVASEETFAEFERVLEYDHLPFTAREQERFPKLLRKEATIVHPETAVAEIDEDPDDDMFLECAVEADADFLLSGNDHVLDVEQFRGTEIVSPAAFLERY